MDGTARIARKDSMAGRRHVRSVEGEGRGQDQVAQEGEVTMNAVQPITNGKDIEDGMTKILLDKDPRTPADFAPPTPKVRVQRTAKLTGEAIRKACEEAGKAIMDVIDDAEQQIAAKRLEATDFISQLKQVGEEKAAELEKMMGDLEGSLELVTTAIQRAKAGAS